ncbi:unnamed protein product [Adineta ricciae]|uniref:Uncharacterized protein n=1 Tax=Adineta ricciae TaxID=249248 RepID=A0A815M057_ADIRI|nr:unnamed protein product [Adineta ricciae]CAF1639408.1 unnamed protein product [Adineta ricciae]
MINFKHPSAILRTLFCLLSAVILLLILSNNELLAPKLRANSSFKASRWRKDRLVIIPAIYQEIDWYKPSTWPNWLKNGLDMFNTSSSRPYDIYLYQRADPESKAPFNWPYCKNVHEEAGVYLKFIYDFYYDLPDRMLFIHGQPERHGLYPIEAAQCVRDDVYYTSVNNVWFQDRPWIAGKIDPVDNITVMYKCGVYLLSLFGFDGELQLNPKKVVPKDMSIFSILCCAQFYVRKERILHYTYEQWSTVYNASLQPYCTTPLDREILGTNLLRTFGSAMEILWHIILGFGPAVVPLPRAKTNTDLCHIFRSSCFGSLCGAYVTGIKPGSYD